MINWLHDWPPWLGAGAALLFFVVPTLLGSYFLQPFVVRLVRGEKDPNYPVALLLSCFSLYYGVLLALLSVAVFENYGKTEDAVAREASSLVALYRNVTGYPEAIRGPLIDLMRRYVAVETEPAVWRAQYRGVVTTAGAPIVDEINRILVTARPERRGDDDALHRETLRQFSEFIERRHDRIQAGTTGIPSIIWHIVMIGAALNVFILWLFELGRRAHMILGGALMLFISLVIYMVAVLDEPFRGENGIAPVYLLHARDQMRPM